MIPLSCLHSVVGRETLGHEHSARDALCPQNLLGVTHLVKGRVLTSSASVYTSDEGWAPLVLEECG